MANLVIRLLKDELFDENRQRNQSQLSRHVPIAASASIPNALSRLAGTAPPF